MVLNALIKRHLTIYIRDRWAVFFSLLSILIVLMLFMVFLRASFENAMQTEGYELLIHSWIISGVLMISTMTVPLGFLGIMIRDMESGVINDFLVAPITRWRIVFSYLVAALIIGTIFSILNLVLGQIYLFVRFRFILDAVSWLWLLFAIVLSTSLFSSLFFFISSHIKTSQAHGTLNTLVGTLIGFLAGLYVPLGVLGSALRTFLTALPTMQLASLFRLIYMATPLSDVAWGHLPNENQPMFEKFMGVRLELFGSTLSLSLLIIIIIGWVALFTLLSVIRIARFKVS